jgi:hypothetical protein
MIYFQPPKSMWPGREHSPKVNEDSKNIVNGVAMNNGFLAGIEVA